MNDFTDILMQLNDRLSRIEIALSEPREPESQKEWYTIAEMAEILGKASFTCREWARLGRINAIKRSCGRGKSCEWIVSRNEIERIRNKGLLPSGL